RGKDRFQQVVEAPTGNHAVVKHNGCGHKTDKTSQPKLKGAIDFHCIGSVLGTKTDMRIKK
ncbi:MAG: hypothetical protein R6U85_10525, partial [Salinivirgaceae bacterium]